MVYMYTVIEDTVSVTFPVIIPPHEIFFQLLVQNLNKFIASFVLYLCIPQNRWILISINFSYRATEGRRPTDQFTLVVEQRRGRGAPT
jgi:hypothetical protein